MHLHARLCIHLHVCLFAFSRSLVCAFACLLVSAFVHSLIFAFADSLFSRVHATLQPALSVRRSVGRSHFTFFYDFISLTSLLLPKWSGDLEYGHCPAARNLWSRELRKPCIRPFWILIWHRLNYVNEEFAKKASIYEWMIEWMMNEPMNECMNKSMNEQVNEIMNKDE